MIHPWYFGCHLTEVVICHTMVCLRIMFPICIPTLWLVETPFSSSKPHWRSSNVILPKIFIQPSFCASTSSTPPKKSWKMLLQTSPSQAASHLQQFLHLHWRPLRAPRHLSQPQRPGLWGTTRGLAAQIVERLVGTCGGVPLGDVAREARCFYIVENPILKSGWWLGVPLFQEPLKLLWRFM